MSGDFTVLWTKPAREDFDDIIDYITQHSGTINAEQVLHKIEKAIVYVMMLIDERRNLEDILLRKFFSQKSESPAG